MTPILKKQFALLGVGIAVGGIVLRAWISEARIDESRSTCQMNLKEIAFGMQWYRQDFDERFPPADGWRDRIAAFAHEHPEEPPFYNCPSVSAPNGNGYAINAKIGGQSMAALVSPQQAVQLYETTTLAHSVQGDGGDMAYRHRDGANFAFADGHVRWFSRNAVPSFEVKLIAKGRQPK